MVCREMTIRDFSDHRRGHLMTTASMVSGLVVASDHLVLEARMTVWSPACAVFSSRVIKLGYQRIIMEVPTSIMNIRAQSSMHTISLIRKASMSIGQLSEKHFYLMVMSSRRIAQSLKPLHSAIVLR